MDINLYFKKNNFFVTICYYVSAKFVFLTLEWHLHTHLKETDAELKLKLSQEEIIGDHNI